MTMSGYTILILVGLALLIFILSLFLYYDCEENNGIELLQYPLDDGDDFDENEGIEFLREMKNKDKEKNNKNDKSIK